MTRRRAEVRSSFITTTARIPGHTTRAPPIGFELETNGFQFYAIANLNKRTVIAVLGGKMEHVNNRLRQQGSFKDALSCVCDVAHVVEKTRNPCWVSEADRQWAARPVQQVFLASILWLCPQLLQAPARLWKCQVGLAPSLPCFRSPL